MAESDYPQMEIKDGEMRLSTRLIAVSLPQECESGVALNLTVLADHAAIVRQALRARTAQ